MLGTRHGDHNERGGDFRADPAKRRNPRPMGVDTTAQGGRATGSGGTAGVRVSRGGRQAQGEVTTQLVSSAQAVALSQAWEPPWLAT